MGIATARLELEKLSTLTTENISTISDTIATISSKPVSELSKQNFTTSILDPILKSGAAGINTGISILENTACSAAAGILGVYDSLDIKLPKMQTAMFKDLQKDFKAFVDNVKPNINLSDYKISKPGCADKELSARLDKLYDQVKSLDLKKGIIPREAEALLGGIIGATALNSLKSTGLFNADLKSIVAGVKGELVSKLNANTLSLKEKLELQKYFDKAGSIDPTGMLGINSLITKLSTARVFDTLNAFNGATAVAYLDGMLTDGESRTVVMSSLTNSIANSTPDSIEDKLLLMSSFKETSTDTAVGITDSLYARTDTEKVLSILGDSSSTSKSPMSNYEMITDGLSVMNPNWDKDDTGISNLSIVSDNMRMVDLSNSQVNSRSYTGTVSGDYSTTIDNALAISILNTFSSQQPSLNCGCS